MQYAILISKTEEDDILYTQLTIQEKLKDERTKRNLTLLELEEATGIGHATLGKYESEQCTDISAFYLSKLAKFYGVSTDYLLGLTENKNHPNTALNALHLSDSAIAVLTGGQLNNRLLSEMICHSSFRRFLVDVEICVDRIADMHLKDMNLLLNLARREITNQYHPDEDELSLRTLELSQVDDEIFYRHVLHKDLDAIVKDIRTAHETDITTAEIQTEAQSIAQKIPLLLAETRLYAKNPDEMRAFLMCNMLNIPYDKLSNEEKMILARVFKKSPQLASSMNRRGKGIPNSGKKR